MQLSIGVAVVELARDGDVLVCGSRAPTDVFRALRSSVRRA